MSCGKRKKSHCPGNPNLKISLREQAPDPVKRLRHSTISSHAYSFKFSRYSLPPPASSPPPPPAKIARKSIRKKWSIRWESSSRLKQRSSLTQKKIQVASIKFQVRNHWHEMIFIPMQIKLMELGNDLWLYEKLRCVVFWRIPAGCNFPKPPALKLLKW